ncbi:MAG: AsmA family protein [Pseudohongiellaceae bacterium]
MRTLLKIALVVALLVVVIAVGFTYYINSGQYRGMLERAVADSTGYELTIAGEVDLNLFPSLGMTLNDVRLTNPAVRQELLSTSRVLLRLDVRALLGRRLLIEELQARNFHVNYYVNADGSSNWNPPAGSGRAPTEAETSTGANTGASGPVALSFDRIDIQNTSIDYQDLAQGVRYQIDNFNLVSLDTNLAGRPFDINIDFDFENNGMSEPVPIALRSNVLVDLNNGTLNFNNVQASITPLLLQGEVSVVNFDRDMQFSGNLRAEPFDVRGLLETLALVPAVDGPPQSRESSAPLLSFATEFSGNETEATVPSFNLRLDEADINGTGSVRIATALAPTNISYNLMGGDLDLTPFMSTGDEEAQPANADAGDSIAIPVDALSAFNLLGSTSLSSLTLGDMRFDNINVFTNLEDRVLDIEVTPISTFDGSLEGALRLDARVEPPALEADFSIAGFNLGEFAPRVSRFNNFAGDLNMEATHSARGTTVSELLQTLTGSTTFSVDNSSIDITLIKQVFTAIAALSPSGGSIQQWPDVIRFSDLGGFVTLEEGLQVNQNIKLRMDNFDITGSGGLDLAAGSFDYDLLFTVLGESYTQTIPIDERYHDVSWPVQCTAAFDAPVNQYCRPDFSQVRDIFAQLGTQAARNRLDEVVTDQVPDDLQDAARGLLRNILN